jgi:hypothetical protein
MFPFTVWHGTSAHLLPKIQEYGLGGRNPMADWRVMEFLMLALETLNYDEYDFAHPDCIDLMSIKAASKGGAKGMNFEYGDVYVAGGYQKAANYAVNAPELISFVRTVLEVADRRRDNSVRSGLSDYPQIAGFISLASKPVVLKLPPLPMAVVATENGGQIKFRADTTGEAGKAFLSQMSYRLTSKIPFDEIEVLDASDHVFHAY